MVGYVESGAFEDDRGSAVNALRLTMAVGANGFGVVVKAGYPFKDASTYRTAIFVYWHVSSLI